MEVCQYGGSKVHSFQYYLGSLKISLLGWIFILFPWKTVSMTKSKTLFVCKPDCFKNT